MMPSTIKGDVYGGLTAGIVALPLALAFGEASGAGPMAGLWGAIITGFFAAIFGGTRTQITGPTGPMVVVFAGLVSQITQGGAMSVEEVAGLLFAAVVLAGLFQVALGLLRFGEYIRLVPYPVISGFMTGVGVIIILLQTSRLFGGEPERGGTLGAIEAIPPALINMDMMATGVGLLTLLIVFFWPRPVGRYLPAPLAALLIGTVIALPLDLPTLGLDLPRFDQFTDRLPSLVIPTVNFDVAWLIVKAAIILAVLGAIDSLLTSLVADNATRTRHDSNRELIGQGIANSLAGFCGAIPGAGATMRTMVNIRTGGATRLSGAVHSLVLLGVVLLLTPLAAAIPYAVLAGILVKVGWDIIDIPYLRHAHKGPRWDLLLMALVLLVTVFIDLITAVGLGVFLAAMGYAQSTAKQQLDALGEESPTAFTDEERRLYESDKGRIRIFEFSGPLSFGAAADIAHRVRENVHGHEVLILDFAPVPSIDVSAAYALETIIEDAFAENRFVLLANLSDAARQAIEGLGVIDALPPDQVGMSRLDALRRAGALLETNAASGDAGSDHSIKL